MKKIIVGFFLTIYIIFFSVICFLKFNSFEYHDFDLAAHCQTLWNIIHGSTFNSILGIDFLGNHNHLILFLLAPIYKLFPSPLTLLFIQTVSLGLGVIPVYFIARKLLSEKFAALISVMYLAYPALGYTNLFEFHPTVFAVPFLLFMFYFFLKNKFWQFVVFLILSLSCQENISLVIFMLGIFIIFSKRSKKWFLVPIISGALWFSLSIYVIMPHFNRGEFKLIWFYQQFGSSFAEVFKNIIMHPLFALKIMFSKQKIIFLFQVFAPVSFLPLISPGYLFIILPLFLQHLLSFRPSEHTIQYHYLAEIIPFIFISAIYGIRRFFSLRPIKNHETLFISIFLISSIFYSIYLGPYPYVIIDRSFLGKDKLDTKKEEFIKRIPSQEGVIASFEFLPKLANRKLLFSFHNVTTGFYPYSNKSFTLPGVVKYAIVDFDDPLTISSFFYQDSAEKIRKFLSVTGLVATESADTVVLFEKGARKKDELYEILYKQPKIEEKTFVNVSNCIELLGYKKKGLISEDNLNFIFYWKPLNNKESYINVYFDIMNSKNEVVRRFLRPICFRIYPTHSWKNGEIIVENRSLIIPKALPKGHYFIKMGFIDEMTRRILFASTLKKDLLDSQRRVKLADFYVN